MTDRLRTAPRLRVAPPFLVPLAALLLGLGGGGCATPASEPELAAMVVLDRYADAYMEEDLEAMASVWAMGPAVRDALDDEFGVRDTDSIQIRPTSVTGTDRHVHIEFERIVRARTAGGATVEATRWEAQVERRGNGEWVITQLEPVAPVAPAAALGVVGHAIAEAEAGSDRAGPGAAALPPVSAPPAGSASREATPEEAAAVERTLERYEAAYESRSLEEIKRVWDITRVETYFLERTWRGCEEIDVILGEPEIRRRANHATVTFPQELRYDCAEGEAQSEQVLRARLVPDDDGGWRIARVYVRSGAPPLLVRAQGGVTSASQEMPALGALYIYKSAFEACDLQKMSEALVMTENERTWLTRFCTEHDGIEVALEQKNLELDGDGGVVKFRQHLTWTENGRVKHAMANMRAGLVKRATGEWTMWNLRPGR